MTISPSLYWFLILGIFVDYPAFGPSNATTTLFSQELDDSASCYRIPVLAKAKNGTLLAVADQRIPDCSDLRSNPDINLVIRRSTDEGKTWSSISTLIDLPNGQSASDASIIVDQNTGTIFLLYNFMDLQSSPNEYRFHLMSSTDHGQSWSEPADITQQIKPDVWKDDFVFITSGRGAQTEDGHLLFCLVHLEKGVYVVQSQDGGQNWFRLATPLQPADESKIVALPNGTWMVNSRVNQAGIRYVHLSNDKGKTWRTKPDSNLVDPGCNASIYFQKENNHLYFTNLKHPSQRRNLVLHSSTDFGHSWQLDQVIETGSAAYSSMVNLSNNEIGVLYERNDYQEIVFWKKQF